MPPRAAAFQLEFTFSLLPFALYHVCKHLCWAQRAGFCHGPKAQGFSGDHTPCALRAGGLHQEQAAQRRADRCQHPCGAGGAEGTGPPAPPGTAGSTSGWGQPRHGPGNWGHIPCFILPPNQVTGTRQPPALLKTGGCHSRGGCVGWCRLQEPGQARLAGAGAQGCSWRGAGPHPAGKGSAAGAGVHTPPSWQHGRTGRA